MLNENINSKNKDKITTSFIVTKINYFKKMYFKYAAHAAATSQKQECNALTKFYDFFFARVPKTWTWLSFSTIDRYFS